MCLLGPCDKRKPPCLSPHFQFQEKHAINRAPWVFSVKIWNVINRDEPFSWIHEVICPRNTNMWWECVTTFSHWGDGTRMKNGLYLISRLCALVHEDWFIATEGLSHMAWYSGRSWEFDCWDYTDVFQTKWHFKVIWWKRRMSKRMTEGTEWNETNE